MDVPDIEPDESIGNNNKDKEKRRQICTENHSQAFIKTYIFGQEITSVWSSEH